MSRPLRRTLSWLFVMAILFAALIGWNHVPGAGGVVNELRWLLARDQLLARHTNQAYSLLTLAERRQSGARADLLLALLDDGDGRVVRGALTVLGDCLRSVESRGDLRAVVGAWLGRATLKEKIGHLPHSLLCAAFANVQFLPSGVAMSRIVPPFEEWDPAVTMTDVPWLVAATVHDHLVERDIVDRLLLGWTGREGEDGVAPRLRALDSLPGARLPSKCMPIAADLLRQRVWPPIDAVASLLHHPIDEVRWGAGRILAVAGDARGMPAFCEWLSANPGRRRRADVLMTEIYGPDWRELCESGGAASQPGAGDGGG